MPLSITVNERARDKAKAQICAMIDENWDDICKMRDLSALNYSKQGNDGKFKFGTSLKIVQIPKGATIDVQCKVSCSASMADETDFVSIDDQEDLGL